VVDVDQHDNIKAISAVIGAGVVVLLGAVAVANAPTRTYTLTPEETATTTTPPTAPETSVATPPMTATTPAGYR
jgi:hypothetical protein